MKPEQAERLLIEGLFQKSIDTNKIDSQIISQIEKLTGDASTRKYYRVSCPNKSYVVCLGEPSATEVDFVEVQGIFSEQGVRVPELYDKRPKKGYLLEEDLGDITFLQSLSRIENVEEELSLYKNALDAIIKVHRIDPKNYPKSCFAKRFFDFEKLYSEIEFSHRFFLERLMGRTLGTTERNCIEKSFKEICTKIASRKRVVTHRDYHSRNIMLVNGKQVVIDFQDARLGIPQYDLCSLLEDCYYDLDQGNVEILKKYYWDNFLSQEDHYTSYEDYLYYYDLTAIQRVYKALGSFSYIYALRGDIRYLKYIGYGFENLKKILFRHQDYSDLRKLLSRFYYEY